MSGHAEVYLETDRTRVVSDLESAPDRETDPTISLNPREASVTVRATESTNDAKIEARDANDTETGAELGASFGAGYFRAYNDGGATGIVLNAASPEPFINIPSGQMPGIQFTPGEMTVHPSGALEPQLLEAQDTGELILRNEDDVETGYLDGETGTLELRGSPEVNPDRDVGSPQPEFGGGDVVVASQGDPDNIHLHVKGEEKSDYGVDDDNRPFIVLDGPDAILSVGRHQIGAERYSEGGTITLRDGGQGEPVLELKAEQTATQDFTIRQFGEIEFGYYDAPKLRHRGSVRAHPNGLMVTDAGGYPALLITPTGDLQTRKPTSVNNSL